MRELGYCLAIMSSVLMTLRSNGTSERDDAREEKAKEDVFKREEGLQTAVLKVDNLILPEADIEVHDGESLISGVLDESDV